MGGDESGDGEVGGEERHDEEGKKPRMWEGKQVRTGGKESGVVEKEERHDAGGEERHDGGGEEVRTGEVDGEERGGCR